MQVVYQAGARVEDVELRLGRPDATVGELAAALAAPSPDLVVGGRLVAGGQRLDECGLVAGMTVRPVGAAAERKVACRVVVRVVGGLSAGRSIPLSVGTATVGRGTGVEIAVDDPAVSRAHCRIEVRPDGQVLVADLGSRNGTDINRARISTPTRVGPDDLVCVGGVALLRVLPIDGLGDAFAVDPRGLARPGGRIPFSRAPRPVGGPEPGPVVMPAAPGHGARRTFGIAMIVGSFVMAAVSVLMTKDLRYAALAGLSPLMLLANLIEDRTKGRRSLRRQVRGFGNQLAAARTRLIARHAAEIRSRHSGVVDPAEALFRATAPSVRLWERRPPADDFMRLSTGIADLAWAPPVTGADAQPAPEVTEALAAVGQLPAVPVPVDLRGGAVLGLDGNRAAAMAVARSLLAQAVSTAGPADLTVVVCTDAERVEDWDWTKWLPHVADRRGGGSARLLAVGPAASAGLATELLEALRDSDILLLVVVDGATLLEGRPCPLRDLLAVPGGKVAGLVLTDRLPAQCTVTLTVSADGHATLRRLTMAETVTGIMATGMDPDSARSLARALARFEDPELRVEGAGLPDQVCLLPLLDLPDLAPQRLLARWRHGAIRLRADAVLGVTEQGLFRIDLDDDGPHGLIAGTTGSGKSELLRTLVASLAVGNDPDHLTFALVDYKGGGALDECARLPHAVGLVTDLDEQLGERALRCLEAELRHREQLLRRVGLGHVRDYQRLRDTERPDIEPMPRLVVVIDEFATLAKALPDFVDALVSIAQRGRSLGMHLIMATQRPAGSVSEAIKNNVKLRIALRLESAADSNDVIDAPTAADIGGRQWGRAFHRISAREVEPVQTALATAVSKGPGSVGPVSVLPFRFGRELRGPETEPPADGPTDLRRLVDAAGAAFAESGWRRPRRPWPEPLPGRLPELPQPASRGLQTAAAGLPAFALADDPDRQTQYPVGWDPDSGNLLLYGVVGAGTTSALAALALAWAQTCPPDRVHVYVLDMAAGDLAPLAALPHTGAYVGVGERERQVRLIRLLRTELDARKRGTATDDPRWIVLLDNIAALTSDFDRDLAGMNLLDDLARVYADGPAVGIHLVVTADRSGSVPHTWAQLTQQKLLFRLADAGEYGLFDVPRHRVPAFVPGRAVVAATTQVVQVHWVGQDLPAAVVAAGGRWPDVPRTARAVRVLPTRVTLPEPAHTASYPWRLPVGLDAATLDPAELVLYEHEHAIIAGPARSGRSTALCALAGALRSAVPAPTLLAMAGRRSPVGKLPGLAAVLTDPAELASLVSRVTGPAVLLIDDADQVADSAGDLDQLLERQPVGLHVLAAGRADNLRHGYGHWTQRVRESRCGVLLTPDYDLDGDLLSVELPRLDRVAALPGRGYLAMNGMVTGVQLALPEPALAAMKEGP